MDRKNHVDPSESLKDKLSKVRPYNSRCCIYRVPPRLRSVKEAAYTPRVVSIGPIHHRKSLKIMEEHKLRFLIDFLWRTNRELDHYIGIVKEMEETLRGCYEETFDELSSDEFVTIILVDAVFVVEVFLTNFAGYLGLPVENERVLNAKRVLEEVSQDLLLLENQLPFSVLEEIWNCAAPGISTSLLFYEFFSWGSALINEEDFESIIRCPEKPEHFVDMVRKLHIPLNPNSRGKAETFQTPKIDQFLDLVRKPWNVKTSRDSGRFHAPSVTQLRQAGLEFREKSESRCLLDISYKQGTLEIPKWRIEDSTQVKFRNLIAFEQCHCEFDKQYASHYGILMEYLIDNSMDVDLLEKEGIVENWRGDNNDAAGWISKLGFGTIVNRRNFYFGDIFRVLNEHYGSLWYGWKANLKQNYFNTPWAYLSFLAALILLILTTIQTMCSILSTFD